VTVGSVDDQKLGRDEEQAIGGMPARRGAGQGGRSGYAWSSTPTVIGGRQLQREFRLGAGALDRLARQNATAKLRST
jgi:hypothetical protein